MTITITMTITIIFIRIMITINNYLITEREVVTGKSQTEALPY